MPEHLVLPTQNPTIEIKNRTTIEEDAALFELYECNREHLREPTDSEDDPSFFPTQESVTEARQDYPSVLRMGIWKDQSELMGEVVAVPQAHGNQAEIGYFLREEAMGNGYATVAVRALTDHLLQSYGRVLAKVHVENSRSMGVVQRAGFVDKSARVNGLAVYERHNPSIHPNPTGQTTGQIMGILAEQLGVEIYR